MFKVGVVTHYYKTTGMALVNLDGEIAVHDKIRFLYNHDYLFSQIIDIIQVGHDKVGFASRGDVVALKTNEMVSPGTEIFKES